MSTKKRDLAEELVDFLLKEDELKKAVQGAKKSEEQERTKPVLVQEHTLVDKKTVAITNPEPEPEVFEFNVPVPHTKPEEIKPVSLPEYKSAPSIASKQFVTQRASMVFNDVAQLMAGTEAVKVAQARINTLEKEKENARTEMDMLLTSSESMQRRLNELKAGYESLERKHREKIEILEDEKSVIKARLNAKDAELTTIKRENADLQSRFQNDLRKIRVRERELEHRQEIIRAEMVTVVSSKDEVIVELKRQLEKLHFELDNFRAKSADMNTKLNEFNDRNHRTVKALRLALSVLETGDVDEK
jgi:hypothetical protein